MRSRREKGGHPARRLGIQIDRCGPTKRVRYRSERAAMAALEQAKERKLEEDHRRREQRAYWCIYCSGWHLTSQAPARSGIRKPIR